MEEVRKIKSENLRERGRKLKKKTFYSLYQKSEVTGAVKHNGFQFEKNGMKFYVYQNKEGAVYIIDPQTGLSLTREPFSIEDAPSCISEYRIKQLEERRKSEEYQIKVKMFKALKKAAKVKEECEMLLKGIKENCPNGHKN